MKYVQLIICVLVSLNVAAQQDRRFKLKATGYSIAYFDKAHDLVLSLGWRDTSLIIVMNPKEKVIMIYGKTDKTFDVTKAPVSSTYAESEYLKWIGCIDKDGIRCNIRLSTDETSKETGVHFLFIDYADIVYTYLVKEQ